VDRDSIDRIRSATFPVARRGYEKREVDRFLSRLADWLETGGADQSRSETVRRDLERVGQKTSRILVDAHDTGEQLLAEARQEAEVVVTRAREEAARILEAARAEATRVAS
jgi:DivIVA domain-containing protein